MLTGIHRSPIAVILLTFVTFGIYSIYWVYKVAQELQLFLHDEDLEPGLDCFLMVICFPYQCYWWYKYGKAVARSGGKVGLNIDKFDHSLLYLILSIFGLGIINMALMQSNLNKIWNKAKHQRD